MKKNLILEQNPISVDKEISVLYELGLEKYEIEFLVYLKTKKKLSEKWETKDQAPLSYQEDNLKS